MSSQLHSLWLITIILCEVKSCGIDIRLLRASVGDDVIFDIFLRSLDAPIVPFHVQWIKRAEEEDNLFDNSISILGGNENNLIYTGTSYEGRVSLGTSYGAASLNLTNINDLDRGMYICMLWLLNQSSETERDVYPSMTYYYLAVNVPPYFIENSPRNIFVDLGEEIVLTCKAEGLPLPEIVWYKGSDSVNSSTASGLFNNDMELRISNISHEDVENYTCEAQNGENLQASYTMSVFLATAMTNQTKFHGENAEFVCNVKTQLKKNVVRWFHNGVLIEEIPFLKNKVKRRGNSIFINSVTSADSGQFSCQVSDDNEETQSMFTYLNVQKPPKETSTPSVEYLPLGLSGTIHCNTNANLSLRYVTWTKDKRLLKPSAKNNILVMKNGSLIFTQVNENHEGVYICTPRYVVGNQGFVNYIKVLVHKPPIFTIAPNETYHGKLGTTLSIHCDARESEGTQKPTIKWQRQDGGPLRSTVVETDGGTLIFRRLGYFDYGFYQCVASNEVTTIFATTLVTVSGTPPQPPFNVTVVPSKSAVTVSWLPGYEPDFIQSFMILYRKEGVSGWNTIYVPFRRRRSQTQMEIEDLNLGTSYEFKLGAKSKIGPGIKTEIVTVRTEE